jgi:hypothetical protein
MSQVAGYVRIHPVKYSQDFADSGLPFGGGFRTAPDHYGEVI